MGRLIYALRASVLRTSGKDHGLLLKGWPTPDCQNHRDGTTLRKTAIEAAKRGSSRAMSLHHMVILSGWPTPVANDDNKTPEAHLIMKKRMGERDGTGANRKTITSLQVMAKYMETRTPVRLTDSGEMLTGSDAGMENSGQLDPAHPRWLMGLPPVWDDCAVMAMQSMPKLQRRSSRRTSKRKET